MTIKYTLSVVTIDALFVRQLQLENDPVLLMRNVKDFLNERIKQSKLKIDADAHVVDIRSLYKPTEEKYYFYVTTKYTYEERE